VVCPLIPRQTRPGFQNDGFLSRQPSVIESPRKTMLVFVPLASSLRLSSA